MSHAEPDEAALFDALVQERRSQDAPAGPPPEVTQESQDEPAPEAGSVVSGDAKLAEPDIDLASLPESVRARIEKAEQLERDLAKERSDRLAALNRLQPTQRRLADLERQLAQVSKPAAPAATAAPAAPDIGSPKWDAWAKNFPEEAEAILERDAKRDATISELEKRLAQLQQTVEPKLGAVDSFVQEHTKSRELAALSEAHPDWQQIVFPQSDDDAVQLGEAVVSRTFGAWLSVQNPVVQQLYGSNSAQDNADLLDMFKRDNALAQLHQTAPPSPEAEAAARAHQRREHARASSVAPDLRGQSAAARVDPTQMSDTELFDHLVRQRKANR
jgi:hypothetical protein